MTDKSNIENFVLTFLSKKSSLIKRGGINSETELFSEGILDSLAFLELVDFVENEYQISLNEEVEISPETFGTLSKITKIINSALIHQKK
jgi:acyl carrier protein